MDDLHHLRHFLHHSIDGVRLLDAEQGAPLARVGLHRLGLGEEEDGMPHVFGRELAPMVVELDALAEGDGPAFGIGSHLPLLCQLRNIGPGAPVDADEELQGGPFIQVAAAGVEPREVGVPTHGRRGDPQSLQWPFGWCGRRGRLGPDDRSCQSHGAHAPHDRPSREVPVHAALLSGLMPCVLEAWWLRSSATEMRCTAYCLHCYRTPANQVVRYCRAMARFVCNTSMALS